MVIFIVEMYVIFCILYYIFASVFGAEVKFAWYDGWIGFFVDTKDESLYILVFPFVVSKYKIEVRK